MIIDQSIRFNLAQSGFHWDSDFAPLLDASRLGKNLGQTLNLALEEFATVVRHTPGHIQM